MLTHWIYPVSESLGWTLGDERQLPVTPENVRREAQRARRSAWGISTSFHKVAVGDLVWIYFSSPDRHIRALARIAAVPDLQDPKHAIDLVWDVPIIDALSADPIPYAAYGQHTQAAVTRANDGTRNFLEKWMSDRTLQRQDWAEQDLDDEGDARLHVLADVIRRQGQSKFRQELLMAYNQACCITGCDVGAVLEAAHIRAYQGAHTNRLSNGLLLRSDLHLLFDLHLIAIDSDYKILVSANLDRTIYARYRGQSLRLPKTKGEQPSRQSLAKHAASLVVI